MKRLENKVAVIFGATSGIGRCTAIRFAAEGACVNVVGRNAERGEAVVKEICDAGGKAIFTAANVLIEEEIVNAVKTTVETFGKLDIVVNSAGNAWNKPIEDLKTDDWDLTMNTNLRSAFYSVRCALPYLIETKGNVINISSMGGLKPMTLHYAYCSSKAGLVMFTKTIAHDFADKGVRSNVICPGLVDTPLLGVTPKEIIKALEDEIPLKRMAQPEEIANMALFLASDEALDITGQIFAVDGGGTLL